MVYWPCSLPLHISTNGITKYVMRYQSFILRYILYNNRNYDIHMIFTPLRRSTDYGYFSKEGLRQLSKLILGQTSYSAAQIYYLTGRWKLTFKLLFLNIFLYLYRITVSILRVVYDLSLKKAATVKIIEKLHIHRKRWIVNFILIYFLDSYD